MNNSIVLLVDTLGFKPLDHNEKIDNMLILIHSNINSVVILDSSSKRILYA